DIGLDFIPGIEISCDYREGNIHILGYWIDPGDERLRNISARLIEYRNLRNHKIVERFYDLGIRLDYDEVMDIAGNDVVGRPHFARALMDNGYAGSIREAFDNFLGEGKSAYVAKRRLNPAEGIELISRAGGIAVLAHPNHYPFGTSKELKNVLKELVNFGLKGIEAYYSTYSAEQTAFYLRMAEEFKLAVSGGTDFHGDIKPEVEIGTGIGKSMNLGDDIVRRLRVKRDEGG
ncbi:MAG: PHP domain-containing protein, partial [FCB group bacterium]|nr:PHP domain-containing protein [FCB group bacterium]